MSLLLFLIVQNTWTLQKLWLSNYMKIIVVTQNITMHYQYHKDFTALVL